VHILIIHQAFAALGEPGGTRHHELARWLARQGHRVTILAGQVSYLTGEAEAATPAEWTDDAGVHIRRCATYRAWHRSFFHRVLSFLSFMISSFAAGMQTHNVDVVWGTTPPLFQGGTAWLLARLKGAAFVFEVRDLWPAFAVAVGVLRSRPLIALAEAFERFLYRHADRLVVNSPGYVEHVLQRGARQVDLVPNGVDIFMFNPAATGAAFRKAHGLQGKFIALYAGALGLSNDLGVVLNAAALLEHEPQIALVLLGDGKERQALVARARALCLPNLFFLPAVPKEEMDQALAAADACIAILKPLDVYKTTYPNKVFDYMAAGRPVILAIDGVIRQLIEEAEAGVFVPPGDPAALAAAIRTLAADRTMGRAMGRSGRAHVARDFDRGALARGLEQVMLRAAEDRKRR
jgi:glycosyltransferase involved in cell wall biosynthesis